MKTFLYILALFVIGLSAGQSAFADIKVKSRQIMAGQSYENTIYIKGKRQRTESMNGMMISLTQCDLRRTVQLNPNSKTYMISSFATDATPTATAKSTATTDKNGVVQAGGKVTSTITMKDTGERKQMFGFTARHLIMTMETVSSPDACNKTNSKMEYDGWYIDAEFAIDCDWGQQGYTHNSGKAGGCRDKYEMKTIGTAKRGYPVYEKMTMFDESGKETYSMVNEVLELSKATLEAGLFDIPADYSEAKDAASMYGSMGSPSTKSENTRTTTMKMPASSSTSTASTTAPLGPKKEGTIRIGLVGVKTGAVGDGLTASDLAAAVQNTLMQYMKVPNLEVVALDAKLSSAIESEAKQKECDYVMIATASHKKGGGGFGGMFGQALGTAVGSVGLGHTGSTAGNIAGHIATQAIVTATSVSANVKAKDEISLDVKLNKIDGSSALAKVYKAKAKANGDDIITQVVEQAAQAAVAAAGR